DPLRAHLASTTRGARACSLSLRGTSGERAGERGTTLLVRAPNVSKTALLSPTLSSLEGRRGRIPAPGVVVLSRCAHPLPTRSSRGDHEELDSAPSCQKGLLWHFEDTVCVQESSKQPQRARHSHQARLSPGGPVALA